VRKPAVNGTPIIITYLELRNVSERAKPIEIPLKLDKIHFKVTDSTGKVVEPTRGPYDGFDVNPGVLRVPFDSVLRCNIAWSGAGIPPDHAAHLDLGPANDWHFKQGSQETYYLEASYTLEPAGDARWSGTIHLPKTKIPTRD
jgi:hypothetical protein